MKSHLEEVCTGKPRRKHKVYPRADHKHVWSPVIIKRDDSFDKCKFCRVCKKLKWVGFAYKRVGAAFRILQTEQEVAEVFPDIPIKQIKGTDKLPTYLSE